MGPNFPVILPMALHLPPRIKNNQLEMEIKKKALTSPLLARNIRTS
jgi:hypothetical protein